MTSLAYLVRSAAPGYWKSCSGLVATILLLSGCATIRGERPTTSSAAGDTKLEATTEKAAEIATQPVRDLGMAKPEIPAVLLLAIANPYAPQSIATCEELTAAIAALNEHLGPDFKTAQPEDKAGNLAAAGGKAIVNSLIPFRGLVREMTGAAEAQRRLEDAIEAGFSRRGFLRGVQKAKKCPATP